MPLKNWIVKARSSLRGELAIPGDKSISHRSLFLGSLAQGITEVSGFLEGEDCLCTMQAFQAMGVQIQQTADKLKIEGVGLKGLREAADVLYMGNSGTSTRLFCGLLAGQNFYSVLSGDKYLNRRPMRRVTQPLSQMGAKIYGRDSGNLAPLTILGQPLQGIVFESPIASAQVKTCLTLAALQASSPTTLSEPYKSRDHTERMLRYLGYPLEQIADNYIRIPGPAELTAAPINVPADISSAAFFIVAALIAEKSELCLRNVGLNPTRSGLIEILINMGAEIKLENECELNNEPRADLIVKSSTLKATQISGALIPRLIDEIPIIAIAAACAEGTTVIKDAAELRVKESDRITAVVSQLKKLGVEARETEDGMVITGREKLSGGNIDSFGDHRIAMCFAVAALAATEEVRINDVECVDTSFPDFYNIFCSM